MPFFQVFWAFYFAFLRMAFFGYALSFVVHVHDAIKSYFAGTVFRYCKRWVENLARLTTTLQVRIISIRVEAVVVVGLVTTKNWWSTEIGFRQPRSVLGMPLGASLDVRVLSSFNTLRTSTTQPITTRWWLYTSYVHSYFLARDVEKRGAFLQKGKRCYVGNSMLPP